MSKEDSHIIQPLTTAMIFAAGLGTRLKPWTDNHPKALFPVNRKPLLQRNLEYLKGYDIQNVVINVHHFAEQIVNFITEKKQFGLKIQISYEKEEPLETGGGLKQAAGFLKTANPFLVMNADILTNLDISAMLNFHHHQQPLVTLAVSERQSSRSFLFTDRQYLCGWRNNKSGEERISIPNKSFVSKAFSGIQIVSPDIFSLIEEQGKFSLVDLYLRLSKHHYIAGYDHTGDVLIDVGKPEAVAQAEKYFV